MTIVGSYKFGDLFIFHAELLNFLVLLVKIKYGGSLLLPHEYNSCFFLQQLDQVCCYWLVSLYIGIISMLNKLIGLFTNSYLFSVVLSDS